MIGNYMRVLPRDLFNEADLLKCYARLWILINEGDFPTAKFAEDEVRGFDIFQYRDSGAITIANLTFVVRGAIYNLFRPLNSRNPWPLYLEPSNASQKMDEIRVFDDEGNLSAEMVEFITR